MDRHLVLRVKEEHERSPLSDFLRKTGVTRALLIRMKRAGFITKNGLPVYLSERVRAHDEIGLTLYEEEATDNLAPSDLPLSVLYEDEDLLALDKPAGLPVHPSRAHVYDTLANRVLGYYGGASGPAGNFVFRAVNRLDKDTSGIVLVAKNAFAAAWYAGEGRSRLRKDYVGLCAGAFPPGLTAIDAPVALRDDGIGREVAPGGERARTFCTLLASDGEVSAVLFTLETGRTHQIRVHAAHVGHPLLGDPLYAPPEGALGMERQALHALRLTMILPFSDEERVIAAPPPADMASLLSRPGLSDVTLFEG